MRLPNYLYITDKEGQYRVKFRTEYGKVCQKVFCNKLNPKEALKRAEIWRDENLPKFRLTHPKNSRLLLTKIQSNKQLKRFPVGVSFSFNTYVVNKHIYSYPRVIATLGYDKNNKVICRNFQLKGYKSLADTISAAVNWRKEAAKRYKKEFSKK